MTLGTERHKVPWVVGSPTEYGNQVMEFQVVDLSAHRALIAQLTISNGGPTLVGE